MAFTRIKYMQPPPDTSVYSLIEIIAICGTFLTVCWRWIDKVFESKKNEKKEFIEQVVTSTMEGCLKDFRGDFNRFVESTENKMTKFNDTVTAIYKDMNHK